MNEFESVILRWVRLFDDFKGTEYSNIENLVSSKSFKGFVNNVFCYKCSLPTNIEDEKLYNTIKVNYDEFEVQNYEDLYNGENSIYTCLVVLLHALLKCADNKFRDQLSERMNDEEQVQLAQFLEATQSSLFTKQTISDALILINCSSPNVSDIFSSNTTPIRSKSMRRSYLQEFCESPKSQSLICQEKEKIIAKLTEDYKNECEENYKLTENVKILQDLNIKLGYKLEDKDKVIKFLKEEIEEFSKPKKSPDHLKVNNTLQIKKLNQDILDLEMNNRELKKQIAEIENKHEDLNGKYEKESSNYQKLLTEFYSIEEENVCLKENISSLNNTIQKKDVELTSIKDELSNKSLTNIPSKNIQEANCASSTNSLFDELSSIKLEEMTRDKEKYRHKYKSLKKDLLNNEKHIKDLDDQIKTVKQQLNDCEVHRNELCTTLSEKKKELQEIQKKNNSLETKLRYLKDSMKDKENRNECLSAKLNNREKQIKEMSVEIDTLKKAKTMIELILSKTNTEIEALHEENNKYVESLHTTIENHKELEEVARKNIIDLENNIKNIQEDLANKESIIIFYEEKMAENYQTFNNQEEQIKAMYHEKLTLESQLNNMKTEIETQQKTSERKYSEMENCLEYHINELNDVKNTTTKVEEMLHCKQNEIDQQTEMINHQKNIIETLQTEKCDQEINLNNLKDTLHQKSLENLDLQENVKKSASSLNKLNEELRTVVNEKLLLENHYKNIETQIKTTSDEFQQEIINMKKTVEHRSNKIGQCKIDLEKLKDALEKKQNDFNEQLIISNKHIETVSLLRLEKYEIEEKLKSNKLCLLERDNEIKTLQDKVIQSELKIKSLSEKCELKILENQVLTKNLVQITSGMENMQGDFEKKLFNMNANIDLYGNKVDAQTEKLFKLNDYLIFNNNNLKTLVDLSGKQKENIMILETEKLDLLEKITVLEQSLLDKNTEILNLGKKLQNHNSTIEHFQNDINILETQKSEYLIIIDCIEKQVIEKNQLLNDINVKLENQIQCGNDQREIIIKINTEKEFINNKIINLEDTLSLKEFELNSCKENLYDCSNIIKNLEAKLDQMKNEKICLELQLNETITQLNNDIQDITLQLKSKEINELQIQEQLINKQNELEKQIEKSNDQIKMISFFNVEKDQLLDYTNKLQECLNEKDYTLKSLEEIIMNYKNQHEESITLKNNLKSELDEQKKQLANLHQESKQQHESMENKYTEIQDKLNKKQVEFDECINKYNCQKETIALLVSDKDNLIEKTNMLSSMLLEKESVIAANQKELLEYKEQNDKVQIEKNVLEIDLKETIKKLDITCQDFTQQLNMMENKMACLNEELNRHRVNSEITAKETSEQKEVITILTSEKHNLINENNTLNKHLLEKENILALNHIKLLNLEKQLEELKIQKICLESNLNESKVQMENNKHDLTEKLETTQIKLKEVQEQIINQQINLNEQTEKISILTCEKNNLVDEINRLNECLAKNEHVLTSNENKLLDFDKQKKEMECHNTSLMFELNQLKCQLNSIRQEYIEQIAEMEKQLCEVREQLSLEHSEKIKKQIEFKNDSLKDIYQKINDLKSIKNELELVIRKEKKDFETCLETYSSFSINCINHKHEPHEDSLMEVITSADTFIEQNGIQLEQVENCDDYSIIERLKKLFEALKMFIININTQGNDRAILPTNNEYVSREVHAELLTKSNMQLETISHLETEMSKLKAECNYKMTKVQQKTQEYITSEYEKKFERKREQMKQFCKDLETKMHQDYEAKLKKYKEKINKDEIHIKELGQQLWEVSDKYLRLQQKERRESTMSLPFEMSAIAPSTVNAPKYNSFTLPKSSSAGQIRSLVEETTRSYQAMRNVPVGIGKKFSLSSGKIFPKEEDEEGEMFNHSCLADLKLGKVTLNDTNGKQFNERVSELQARNSLCPPHLKSSYAVETNYLPNASLITEEDIRTIINYSDCESENLIPNDRNKKKDRNQTSYKKPGPPTPSKNGGRASLSGNTKIALKEQKESVVNKRRGSSTPNKLFSFFGSKK